MDFYAPLIQSERERKLDLLGEITYDIENVKREYAHISRSNYYEIDFCLVQT